MMHKANKVQWHEGMLLEPQHFQQFETYIHQTDLSYLNIAQPHFWGIHTLEIDKAALRNNIFRITSLNAIMPDGGIARVDPADKLYPEIDLSKVTDLDKTQPIQISLAAVAFHPDGANTDGEFPRYDSVQEGPLVDYNTGQNGIYIPKLKLKLHLIPGNTIPARFISFPIATLSFDDGNFTMGDYIPPQPHITPGSPLRDMLNDVVDVLREKINYLATKLKVPKNQDNSVLIETYNRLFNIIAPITPPFECFTNVGGIHPSQMYIELSRLVGHLTTMSPGKVPPAPAPYDHNNLRDIFTPLIKHVKDMLSLVQRLSSAIAFKRENDTFKLPLSREWLWQDRWVVGFRTNVGQSEKDLQTWVQNAIITTQQKQKSARDKRVLGAARTLHAQIPELGLLFEEGMVYALIENNPDFIDTHDTMTLINTNSSADSRPFSVEMFVLTQNDPAASTEASS